MLGIYLYARPRKSPVMMFYSDDIAIPSHRFCASATCPILA